MPSSFSRLLDEDELQKVRQLYLESLAQLEEEEEAERLEAEKQAAAKASDEGATGGTAP